MNERQAIEQGYIYTGYGDRFRDITKQEIVELKIRYPKAKFVMIYKKDSGLSCGGSDAYYNVYGCKKYKAYKNIEIAQVTINQYNDRLKSLTEEFEKAHKELTDNFQNAQLKIEVALETLI